MRDDINFTQYDRKKNDEKKLSGFMKETVLNFAFLRRHKKTILSMILLIILSIFAITEYMNDDEVSVKKQLMQETQSVNDSDNAREVETAQIIVDISGAVKNPGVLFLDEGSRLYEAVEKAGGLLESADITYINQAEILNDGEKIYIPIKSIEAGNGPIETNSYSNMNLKVNLNTATAVELQTLSGVGPSTAEKIIAHRQKERYRKIEDIMNVDGIGEKTFENLKDAICV